MKVILNEYVEHLGERGVVVEVKPGYARNYLLPKRLAYIDTPGNRKLFEQEQKQWEETDLKRRSAAEQVAAGLEGVELIFERRASEKDVLFGSVTTHDIAAELASRGIEIDRRKINLSNPIKELGSFKVPVVVHREITVTLPVYVVRPGEQPVTSEPEVEAEAAVPPGEPAEAGPEAAPEAS
ncbi:MAG: 50S ribosomal protein L9 [Acidobacteria bacterium]|nr:50S ribosomal protein L9 [Acidobacteriota bacterium]